MEQFAEVIVALIALSGQMESAYIIPFPNLSQMCEQLLPEWSHLSNFFNFRNNSWIFSSWFSFPLHFEVSLGILFSGRESSVMSLCFPKHLFFKIASV